MCFLCKKSREQKSAIKVKVTVRSDISFVSCSLRARDVMSVRGVSFVSTSRDSRNWIVFVTEPTLETVRECARSTAMDGRTSRATERRARAKDVGREGVDRGNCFRNVGRRDARRRGGCLTESEGARGGSFGFQSVAHLKTTSVQRHRSGRREDGRNAASTRDGDASDARERRK